MYTFLNERFSKLDVYIPIHCRLSPLSSQREDRTITVFKIIIVGEKENINHITTPHPHPQQQLALEFPKPFPDFRFFSKKNLFLLFDPKRETHHREEMNEEDLPPWMCDTFVSSPVPPSSSRLLLTSSPSLPRDKRRLLRIADDETKSKSMPDDPKNRNRVLMERIRDECKMLSQLCDRSEKSRQGRRILGNEGFSNGKIFYQPPDLSSDNEVVVWLRKLGMEKYAPAFAAEGYDELWLLARITKSDMKNLGVAASDMNQILLPALARLRETLGEGESNGDVKASFAEIMRDMEERLEQSEKEVRVQKERADGYMQKLKDTERRYEDTLKLKEKEKLKIMQDLVRLCVCVCTLFSKCIHKTNHTQESSRRDVQDAKHAVEIAKRDTEDVRSRLNDALNRFEDENSKILVIRRKAADDVMEAERVASAQVMKLRQENLQMIEKIRMECAERVKEMMRKNQERIASAHHAAQEQIAEAQREAARLVADA